MKLIFWSLTCQMPNIIAFSTFSTPDESALSKGCDPTLTYKVVNRYKNFKKNHEILPVHFTVKVLKKLKTFYNC